MPQRRIHYLVNFLSLPIPIVINFNAVLPGHLFCKIRWHTPANINAVCKQYDYLTFAVLARSRSTLCCKTRANGGPFFLQITAFDILHL